MKQAAQQLVALKLPTTTPIYHPSAGFHSPHSTTRDGAAPHPSIPPHLQGAAALVQPSHEGHGALSIALGPRPAPSRAQAQLRSPDQAPRAKEVPVHRDHHLRLLALHSHRVQRGCSLQLGHVHPCPRLGEGRNMGPAPRRIPPDPQSPRVPLREAPGPVEHCFSQCPAEENNPQAASRPHPDPRINQLMGKVLLRSLLYQMETPGGCRKAPTQQGAAQDNGTQLGSSLPLRAWRVISLDLHLGIALEQFVPGPFVLPVWGDISHCHLHGQLATSPLLVV